MTNEWVYRAEKDGLPVPHIVWIYRSILPDPAAGEFYPKQALFANLAEKMRSMVIEAETSETEHLVDLSRIDFEALKARFQKKFND